MKLAQKILNLNELNFILIMVGFQMITTFLPFFPSVLYRGVALGVALLCVLFTKKTLLAFNKPAKLFMLIFLLMIVRCTYQVLFTTDRLYYPEASNMVLLFMYGITLLPVLAFLYGHDNIRWNRIIWILFFLCLIIIFYGVMFSASVNEGSGRMQLNERQSTLAFGDTSAFLLIISSALLMRFKQKNRFAWLLKGCLVVGIILAIVGIARAASRGPLVAGLIGMLFIVEALPIKKKLMVVAAGIRMFDMMEESNQLQD
ncbi:MAG: hypothetical protein EOM50_21265, partial [Erysipelotrichia bacterium]|nr:hypothetical protein [Erysipelotrichia bacterium]